MGEREKTVNLANIQKENNELTTKNKKLSTENKSFSTKISQQKEEIVNKSAAIEKYKKAIARRKESPLNIATKPDSTTNNKASHGGTRFVDHEIEYSSLLQQTIQSL